jgi:NAD(P)-dependent dehydrogenase (short-subunit alcohol dehydrogenase family)
MGAFPRVSLDGQVAIVTGASSGIGLAIARALSEAGADVALAARKPERLEGAAEELRAAGARVLAVPTDVTRAEEVRRLVAAVAAAWGRVDILVNNAGAGRGRTFRRALLLELTEADFDGCYAVNTKSAFLCGREVVPLMRARGKGAILNIGTMAGGDGAPMPEGLGFYPSAKAALRNLTRAMAAEWAPEVRVNCLNPGMVATAAAWVMQDPERARAAVPRIALGRLGQPEDIAAAAAFLVSDAASWITGVCLDVHGGQRSPLPSLADPTR